MFRIGDFSEIARVSGRLLRDYDSIGLLSPQRIARSAHAGTHRQGAGQGFRGRSAGERWLIADVAATRLQFGAFRASARQRRRSNSIAPIGRQRSG